MSLQTLTWSRLKTELEIKFTDSDRERKLLAQFQEFRQLKDLDNYVTNFRKLTLELGKLVTDEAILWQFIRGLKPELRTEVLKDPNLNTVSDAILIAERLEAASKFSENFDAYKTKNKQYQREILDHDPMDIDYMQANNYSY